ncbi:4-oxalocrotonate tautomerase [Cupriavidus sp. TA19]|uniref:tautomerase family protein n=1 Tax=Cupriavidus sp. TA19 TaxID=701108 RepID=UPI00272949D4|nr:tautomerase family protein [Cupriavidus sp. TA19]GLC97595.1 4-oxalocrotonate tautomerase [Cupriavidus sp. TA19]
MPLVTIKGIEGVFSSEEKKKAIRAVHDAMVAIEGKNMEDVTWVIFEEVKSGDWSIGGTPLTAADVKRIQAGG